MTNRHTLRASALFGMGAIALLASGCGEKTEAPTGIEPKTMADALHAVMDSDRTVYTKMVVNRLMTDDKVIKASEHFMDDKALPLPAQMFRFGSEMVAGKTDAFSYQLLSLWPVNKQNAPRTDAEKTGLQYVVDHKGENYYTEEELGGMKYFTAVYPDIGTAPACVNCHKDSPKTDFMIGDVMGGVVIRIPVKS